jgi:hypothetical protein
VKLFRLLAPLAMMIAVGLAAPVAAVDPVPERPMRPEALNQVCTAIAGTVRVDRLGGTVTCDLGDGAILCDDRACGYQLTGLERRDEPPLKLPCERVRGTIRDISAGQIACDLRDGVVTLACVLRDIQVPWWEFPQRIIACDVRWTPSEQPMS